jgi:ligand-binding sensor domain-containing protein
VWLAPIFEEPIEVASGRVQPASSFPGYKRGARLRSTFEDPDGTLWFATAEGLYRFSRGAFSKVPTPGLAGAPAVVARDRSGRLWVGSAGGLFTETGEGGFARASAGGEAAALPVTALAVDRAGHVWAATAAGLVRGGRGEAAVFRGELRGASALVEDRDGNLWIGTASGLVRFRQGRFETYTRTDGLPDDWVTALLEDREGTLWVGTRSGGLAAFSDRTLASLAIDFGGARPTIHALCEDAEGALWLGTADDGLLRVAGVEPAAAAHGLGGAVAPDAALRRGPPTRVLTTRDGLLDDGVPAVHPARGGGVWVGTRAGLQLLRGGVFTRPAHVDDEVTTLREDREGGLWIGGRATLARFHDGRLRTFGPQDGFDARDTRAIYEDSRGAIWVNTMKGVLRYAGGRFSRPPAHADVRAGLPRRRSRLAVGRRARDAACPSGRRRRGSPARPVPAHLPDARR